MLNQAQLFLLVSGIKQSARLTDKKNEEKKKTRKKWQKEKKIIENLNHAGSGYLLLC